MVVLKFSLYHSKYKPKLSFHENVYHISGIKYYIEICKVITQGKKIELVEICHHYTYIYVTCNVGIITQPRVSLLRSATTLLLFKEQYTCHNLRDWLVL
jgi:hypothetical protein